MIGTIEVKCHAHHQNIPLQTVYCYKDSSQNIRLIDVPKSIGNWRLTKVFISVSYPDNSIHKIECKKVANAYYATIPASSISGKSTNGFIISATGIDGEVQSDYILGQGDMIVRNTDGSVLANDDKYNLHLLSSLPEAPYKGDVARVNGRWMIYDGSWIDLGTQIKDVNAGINLSALQIEKLSFDDYIDRVYNDELSSNVLYVTSADYTTGFFKRIIEVAEPELDDDASTKKYVDKNVNLAKTEVKEYTNDKFQPKGNYLTSTTFIPSKTSDIANDSDFKNGAFISGYTYDKSYIDNIIPFSIKELSSSKNRFNLEDRTVNIIKEYQNEGIYLPQKQAGKMRNLALVLSSDSLNQIIENEKWKFEDYSYTGNSDPLITKVTSDSLYNYDFRDISDSKILVDRTSLNVGSFEIVYDWLTFTSIDDEPVDIYMYKTYNSSYYPVPTVYLEYSYDCENWTNMILTYSASSSTHLTLNSQHKKVYIRAQKNRTNNQFFSGAFEYRNGFFSTGGKITVSGKLISIVNQELDRDAQNQFAFTMLFMGMENLVNAEKLELPKVINNYYFQGMFKNCSSLVYPPKVVNGSMLRSSYEMFRGCSSLIKAPLLPATSLDRECYAYMFNNCSSLADMPELPALENLPWACYQGMFSQSGLSSVHDLSAISFVSGEGSQYYAMFAGCQSLSSAPKIFIKSISCSSSFTYMFSNCSSLIYAPDLSVESYGYNTCQRMFNNCISLTKAPKILATSYTEYSFNNMFSGCSNLSSIEVSFTEWVDKGSSSWVDGVKNNSSCTFIKPEALPVVRGTSNIPSNWTVINK